MKKILLLSLFLSLFSILRAQPKNYNDSIKDYQELYVIHHEVVKETDKLFFRFYIPGKQYRVNASFEKLYDSTGFIMKTSGTKDKKFLRYGRVRFTLLKKSVELTVYRSVQLLSDTAYKNYLFLPFTDVTSGAGSYGGGRYLDLSTEDIIDNKIIIDFNKAYNPYCAYASGYNCPIPPKENALPVAIKAGEKAFTAKH